MTKFTQQYVDPFRIFEKVGRLAYKLDVPHDWRVYLVFSVAQLELAPLPTDDPFHCPHSHMPPAVFVNSDTNVAKSFEVDSLLNK